MGLFVRADSPYYWMLLEGTKRQKESTGIRHDATSPQVRKANRDAAEQVYHARMTQLAKGRVGLPITSDETFDTFSKWYETHHTDKHRGAVRERQILDKLRAYFGPMRLDEIRRARWQEYETARLAEGVSLNTVGRELAVMKCVLSAAVGEHIEVSPLAHVKRKTTTLPAKRTMTATEEKAFLEALDDDEIRDLYLVGVGTLLRQANLLTLQRRQLQGARVVVQTKTGPHAIDLSGPTTLQRRARLVLKRRQPKTHAGYFFPTWQARFSAAKTPGLARMEFLRIVRRATEVAGLPWGLQDHGVVWHTLTRASGATRLMRDFGIDMRTVQLLGGWRSLDQMAAYLGVDLAQPAKALGRVKSA